ncbi:MAG: sigma-54-dependent Fis family transcriptional regulator [Phycisphaerales bacterium]|nr:sigma-54-dependent Fis family transcriptional regulator [Phycisphaerales bacterium]
MTTVLVVDDKESLRDSVGFTLQRAGFVVLSAPDGKAAVEIAAKRRPDAVVTDLKMPGMTGVELIGALRELDEDLPIVLMTAYGTVETAVQAIKSGAFDYITKPFEGDELVIAVKRAIEHQALKKENAILRAERTPVSANRSTVPAANTGPERTGLDRLLGESAAMRELKARLRAVAASQGTVLISGESGTGKEVVARALHDMSARGASPFLAVNCAAMSESLLESELFGHERGAFTGAEQLRKGRFELSDGGTLLLDEISEVKPQIQAKLLRVLQERAFERVGSSRTMGIDVRVIATTNRDLAHEVAVGGFRQDLFYRLNVLPLRLPPLRDRIEDVAQLAPHFVREIAAREGRSIRRVSAEAVELMMAYAWPGNVRELQNLCERAVVLCQGEEIDADLIRHWLTGPGTPVRAMRARPKFASENGHFHGPTPVGDGPIEVSSIVEAKPHVSPARVLAASMVAPTPLEDIEREVIVETLGRFNGHRVKTAKALGIGVRTLGLKLKKWKELELVEANL